MPSQKSQANNPAAFTRRGLLAGAAAYAVAFTASPAFAAMSSRDAVNHVSRLVDDIFKVINGNANEARRLRAFEALLLQYADVDIMARSALGAAARQASAAEMRAYTAAFSGYISRKYGRQFSEFIGGEIIVGKASEAQRGYVVESTARLKGRQPMEVLWQISDASGAVKIFNLYVEGISLLTTEREEIGLLLDQSGGKIGTLTERLLRL